VSERAAIERAGHTIVRRRRSGWSIASRDESRSSSRNEALDERDSDSSPGPVVVEVAAALLGDHAVEGAVLRVPLGAVGEPAWEKASRDTAAEKARRDEGEAAIERLKRRDPGGDIAL
jgi:hypothetical protein